MKTTIGGKFWKRDKDKFGNPFYVGYIELGLVGRIECRIYKTLEDSENCDMVLIVPTSSTPLGMLKELGRSVEDLFDDDKQVETSGEK